MLSTEKRRQLKECSEMVRRAAHESERWADARIPGAGHRHRKTAASWDAEQVLAVLKLEDLLERRRVALGR